MSSLNAAISTTVICLRAPVTEDVGDLVGAMSCAMSCAEAKAVLGPSGECHFWALSDWDDLRDLLTVLECPPEMLENMKREWMEPSPAMPFRLGVVHALCAPGQTIPDGLA